jgi:hypothetical protein
MKLITGLPRTRTYWLSKYFECQHEPRVRDMKEDSIICDSSFIFRVGEKHPQWGWLKDQPIVVLTRGVDAVNESLKNYLPDSGIDCSQASPFHIDEILDAMLDLASFGPSTNLLYVRFEDIDDRLKEMCEFLGEEYDEPRHMAMKSVKANRIFDPNAPTGFAKYTDGKVERTVEMDKSE